MRQATQQNAEHEAITLVGASTALGRFLVDALRAQDRELVVVDGSPGPDATLRSGATWISADPLLQELPPLHGHVVLLPRNEERDPLAPWTSIMENAQTVARVLPSMGDGGRVTVISTLEARAVERVSHPRDLELCCTLLRKLSAEPCPPWRAHPICRRIAETQLTAGGIFGLSMLLCELLVRGAVAAERLTVLRLGQTFGPGLEGIVSRLVRDALTGRMSVAEPDEVLRLVSFEEVATLLIQGAGPGTLDVAAPPLQPVELGALIAQLIRSSESPQSAELTAYGESLVGPLHRSLAQLIDYLRVSPVPKLEPRLPVVIPPRPIQPDVVASRQQASLWSGKVKAGNDYCRQLEEELRDHLDVGPERSLLLTRSGTDALRLAVLSVAGPADPRDVAALPSFTYPATADALLQLGYELKFLDVDEATWTMSPDALVRALDEPRIRVVVTVDTFGNPSQYSRLVPVCRQAGVPLVADSAAGLGSLYQGRPLGTQADAHAFSMSFAKVVSASGAGGIAVLPADVHPAALAPWIGSSLMDELHAIGGLDQLSAVDRLVDRRHRAAARYRQAVGRAGGLTLQTVAHGDRHSLVHFVMRVRRPPGRDGLQSLLAEAGIDTRPYFAALHLARGGADASLPVTERLDREVLALPMSSELTDQDAERVAVAVEWSLKGVDERAVSGGVPVAALSHPE